MTKTVSAVRVSQSPIWVVKLASTPSPSGTLADRCRSQARIDPVGDLNVHRRHHEAQVDAGRLQEPVEPGAEVESEGHGEERVDQAHHQHDAEKGFVAPSSGPGGDRVERVDEVFAPADGEDFQHASPPCPCVAYISPCVLSPREKLSAEDIPGVIEFCSVDSSMMLRLMI